MATAVNTLSDPRVAALFDAASTVVARWESGDLAGAVRDLDDAVGALEGEGDPTPATPDAASPEYQQFLAKALEAAEGGEAAWAAQSTGEKLSVAMALDRADWIKRMGYTLVGAVERVGPQWMAMLPDVARDVAALRIARDVAALR